MATKIVFASRLPAAIVDTARAMVPPGFEMTAVDHGTPAFYEALHDAEFYLGFPRPGMGNEFFRAAPRLRLVQLVTAGYDTLDLEAARKAGVPVANCGGSNAVSVAEHTITLMLAVLKRLVWQHNNVVAGKWRPPASSESPVYELSGRTVGIIGLGYVGLPLAVEFARAGFDVTGFDIDSAAADRIAAPGGVVATSIDVACAGADVVITMLPSGKEVREVYLGPGGVLASAAPGTRLAAASTSPGRTRVLEGMHAQ